MKTGENTPRLADALVRKLNIAIVMLGIEVIARFTNFKYNYFNFVDLKSEARRQIPDEKHDTIKASSWR